jgi:hypothetical protein
MSIKPLPLNWLNGPIVDQAGKPSPAFSTWIQQSVENVIAPMVTRNPLSDGPIGKIRSVAVVQGRTEPIATTVGNIDSTGVVLAPGVDFVRAYTNKHLGNVPDDPLTDRNAASSNQKTGGDRAATALDANARLTGTFRGNPVNTSATPAGATSLANDGVSTAVSVSAVSQQFGDGLINYGSASFDPGAFGTFYAWYNDPTFTGGTLVPQFSTSPVNQTAGNGVVPLGKIISVGGSAKTGGGNTGGTTPGGAGGRGFIQ